MILLPLPPKGCDYRHVPPSPVLCGAGDMPTLPGQTVIPGPFYPRPRPPLITQFDLPLLRPQLDSTLVVLSSFPNLPNQFPREALPPSFSCLLSRAGPAAGIELAGTASEGGSAVHPQDQRQRPSCVLLVQETVLLSHHRSPQLRQDIQLQGEREGKLSRMVMLIIPATGRWKQGDQEFKISLN